MKAWEKNIREVEPYVAGEQPHFTHMIKLNTNENPYPPSPLVEEALRELEVNKLRLYPDTMSTPLVKELADTYHVAEDEIFVGVGSDDVLGMAFLTFFNSDKPILFPDITYSFYDVWAKLYRIPYKTPLLDENFHIVKEDYYEENGGVIIANPNAPTSICENLSFLEDIIAHNQDVVVIIDEAYIDFGGESAIELTKKYENLLVVQTFSKSRSLAGIRIGYAIGNKELIAALNAVKSSYNSYTMNYTAITCGAAALRDVTYFTNSVKRIIDTREYVKEELEKMDFTFLDSKTNFLFVTHDNIPAQVLFEAMRKENIFVRYFNKPRIDNFLRITIGTKEEMQVMLGFLSAFLQKEMAE